MFSLTKQIHYFLNRELSELYLSVAIRTFAMSLISIFVPIYLLNIGYTLVEVLLFFMTFCVFHAVFSFFAAKFSLKAGLKHSIALSIPFLIFYFVLLYTIQSYNWPLALLALVAAVQNSLFWISFHTDFARFSNKKLRGEEFSILRLITSTLNVVGPLVGALIISFVSFYYLFLFVSSLLIISLIPLFYSKDVKIRHDVSLKRVFKASSPKNFIVFMGSGAELGGSGVIWPIFIFLIVGTYLSLGIITSIATFLSLITVFIVGRMCDRFKRGSILKIGSVAHSVTWFFKSIASTGPQIILVNSISGIISSFKDIPYNAMVYDKANKKSIVEFIVFREIALQIGKLIFFSLIILLVFLSRGLILAGFASLFYLLF
ncbi:MAG: MFS transporter [Candidatus Aenigmatarchaeota archaeon]